MTKPREMYECPDCQEPYDFIDSAETCCAPEVDSVWQCGDCESIWYDFTEAEFCCKMQEEC